MAKHKLHMKDCSESWGSGRATWENIRAPPPRPRSRTRPPAARTRPPSRALLPQISGAANTAPPPRREEGGMGRIARRGSVELMRFAREHGCAWEEDACSAAAARGNLAVLSYAREHGCPWVRNYSVARARRVTTSARCSCGSARTRVLRGSRSCRRCATGARTTRARTRRVRRWRRRATRGRACCDRWCTRRVTCRWWAGCARRRRRARGTSAWERGGGVVPSPWAN
eukprot:scaffold131185_cov27-Tisochrysis_lutea.AAC.1